MWTIIFSLRNIAESLKSTIFAAGIYMYDLHIYDVRFMYDCVEMYDWQEEHSEDRGAKKGYIINLKL